MDEWDAYLASRAAGSPAGGSAAPDGLWSAGLDDMFATSTPADAARTPASASPAVVENDPFGFTPIAPAQTATPASASPPPEEKRTKTADDFMSDFMNEGKRGGSGKPQTLADLKKKNGGFLNMNGPSQPQSQSPSLMMQSVMNYYEILGLGEMCSLDDIKSVYKKKSLQLHPDRNPNCHEDDKQMFKLITKAYETLSDPQLRQQYDMELRYKNQGQFQQQSQGNWLNHLGGAQRPAPGGFGAPPGGMPGGMGAPPGGNPGFGSPMFGGGPGGMSPPPSQPTAARRSNDPFSGLF